MLQLRFILDDFAVCFQCKQGKKKPSWLRWMSEEIAVSIGMPLSHWKCFSCAQVHRTEGKMNGVDEQQQTPQVINMSKTQDGVAKSNIGKEHIPGSELWTDGLICAFELIKDHRKPVRHKSWPTAEQVQEKGADIYMRKHTRRNVRHIISSKLDEENPHHAEFSNDPSVLKGGPVNAVEILDHKWVPIGWSRIAELVQRVRSDSSWENELMEMSDSEDDYTVADVAAPYWQRPVGPTWWCHVTAGHPSIDAWLNSAHWMHPAIRTALRDESKLISDRMKYLLYEVVFLILTCLGYL
jgi:hypothetical protein